MKNRFAIALMLLLLLATPSAAFRVGPTAEVNGIPYVIYNSTYGLYYGVIGKAKNLLDRRESLTLAAWLISNGGNGASFLLSFPDDDSRHGKEYGFAFDLSGAVGNTVFERYYGIGSNTPGERYTTFNNKHDKLTFQFSRTLNPELILEADYCFANNQFSDIKEGVSPATGEAENNCKSYSGGSVKITFDGRDQSMDPHSGIYALGSVDFGLRAADYAKTSLDLRSYSTPFSPDQILALRGMVSQTGGALIPIYEYASLGGNNTMRGYTVNRFRDKTSALLNAEYRMPTPIFKGLDTVIFAELGKVGRELSALGFENWKGDSGFGLHLDLGGNVIVRGDFGFGTEGMNVYFFYNQAF